MNTRVLGRQLSPIAIAVASALAAGLSDTASAQSDEAALEEITVTGSRIQGTGFTTPTPVTAVSSVQLDMMAPGSLIDALDLVPQFLNNENSSEQASTGSSSGGTNLNLRGLGINRTLTLLDGRRVTPNSKLGATNVDVLPSAIVERVEVVTGGASAAYGTDAVAGVVNFVLDTDFTGLKGNAQGGVSSRSDLENQGIEVVFGTPIGERMHLILSGESYRIDEGTFDDRDWFLQGYSAMSNPEFEATGQGPELITAPSVVGTNFTCGGLIDAEGSAIDRLEFLSDGSVAPFVESDLSVVRTGTNSQSIAPQFGGGSGCNPAVFTGNKADGPAAGNDIDRNSFFSYFDFDLSENVTFFNQITFSQVEAEIRNTSATMAGNWRGEIFQDNAFLPEEVRAVMALEGLESFTFQRDNSDIQARGRELFGKVGSVDPRNKTLSVTTGFRANIESSGFFDDWQLDAHFTHGRNKQRTRQIGFMRTQTLPLAMDAVRHPVTGEIVCRAQTVEVDIASFGTQDLIDNCVPINLFGEGNASPEAIRYALTPLDADEALTQRNELTQNDVEFVASGELAQGFGAGPIMGAFGVGYREQEVTSQETPEFLAAQSTPSNDIQGIRGVSPGYAGDVDIQLFDSFTDTEGSLDVKEVFAEANIPVASLNFNGAARWADYSGSGNQWAYKYGADWQITEGLRLRGTVSRDVRAPTLSERFDTDRGSGTVLDPITGVTNTFSQTNGGNPNVDPEEADTFTAGLVYQPPQLENLSLSLDWWEIDVDGAIGTLGPQRIVDDCLAGAQSLCARITRDPATQLIVDLENTFININRQTASGIDLEATYSIGPWSIRGLVSYLDELVTEIPGADPDDQAGDIRDGNPEWQGNLSLIYANGPFTAFLQQNVIGDGQVDTRFVEGVDIDENDVDAAQYTNLRLSYAMDLRGGRQLEVYGNALNLTDEDPPLAVGRFSSNGGSSATNADLYDVRGRRYVLGLNFDF